MNMLDIVNMNHLGVRSLYSRLPSSNALYWMGTNTHFHTAYCRMQMAGK